MKNYLSRIILIVSDLVITFVSISLAFILRVNFDEYISVSFGGGYEMYVYNLPVYLIVFFGLYQENIYKYRYDFWEETRLILRALFFSFIILLAILALTKSVHEYSRIVILLTFIIMSFLIPISKNIIKKSLFKIGLWKREAEVCGNEEYVKEEVFKNPYLGYVHSNKTNAQTIFIDTKEISAKELQNRLDISLREKKEVLFIPLLQSYNFANARIIELSNVRQNLIVLENALFKRSNVFIKQVSDIVLSILLFPILLLLFSFIVVLMKREEPKGSIFFKQKRMGQNGEEFICYKFRSMYENGDEILETYLKEHPHEIECYDEFHKYKNDPRITRMGRIMRKTSLDELPQIINVLRGEMSLIGPRPYMFNEEEKIGDKLDMVLAVKPGITGLWQVSGRSDVDFHSRVEIDVWYTRNWNLWLDLVILVKTIKVVLFRDGAS